MSTTPQSENPYASPQSEEAAVVSNPTPTWRDGELVVVAPDGELPRRCAKCGGEASGGLHYVYLGSREPTNWRRLAIILMIAIVVVPVLLGIFSNLTIPKLPWFAKVKSEYVFSALIVIVVFSIPLEQLRKELKQRPKSLRYSLCFWHGVAAKNSNRILRWMNLWILIPMFSQQILGVNVSWLLWMLMLSLLALIIPVTRFTFTAQEIARRNELVWLKGAGQAFRDSLPEFPPELAIKQSDER